MDKMLFLSFIVMTIFSGGSCSIELRLARAMDKAVSVIEGYPIGYKANVRFLSGTSTVNSGAVKRDQLEGIQSLGIFPEVVEKFKEMRLSIDLKVESFELFIQKRQKVLQYVGAAYAQGSNILYAVISGEAQGFLTQAYSTRTEQRCDSIHYCREVVVSVPLLTPPEEIAIAQQALRAKAIEEVKAPLRTQDSVQGHFLKEQQEVLSDEASTEDSLELKAGVKFRLMESLRFYSKDDKTFLLMRPEGVLAVYEETETRNVLVWESQYNEDMQGLFEFIIDDSGAMHIVDGENNKYEIDYLPFDF